MSDQGLTIRIQQIVLGSDRRISLFEAAEMALRERFTGPDSFENLIKVTAGLVSITNKALAKFFENPPLPDPGQTKFSFVSVPAIIVVGSGEDESYVPKNQATYGEVKAFITLLYQRATTQRLRAKRLLRDLKPIKDVPEDMPWPDACKLLIERMKQVKPGDRDEAAS